MLFEGGRVYLTYLDDGGKAPVRVFGGIVLAEAQFSILETLSGLIAVKLVPPERREDFEFHASDLFAGTGDFEGIDKTNRMDALRELLRIPLIVSAAYVYSAVDMQKLQKNPFRSARWTDAAFFMCACQIDETLRTDAFKRFEQWRDLRQTNPETTPLQMPEIRPLNLMVIDEPEQGEKDKKLIRASFRTLRGTLPQVMKRADNPESCTWSNRLSHAVDDVFFGSSADSVGLQIADVCNWVMWRYLSDGIQDEFYKQLLDVRVICARPEPEWTENKHLFRTHEVIA